MIKHIPLLTFEGALMKTAVFTLLLCTVTFTHCMDNSKPLTQTQTDDKEKKEISEQEVQLCVQYSDNKTTRATLIKVKESVTYDEFEKSVAKKTERRPGSFSLMVPKSTPEILSSENFTVSQLKQPQSDKHQDMSTFMRIIVTNHTDTTKTTK